MRNRAHSDRLKIKDMYFGSIDATDELDVASDTGKNDFYETFFVVSGLKIEKFLNGESFFIYGPKGTGKTSLLRFLMEKVKRDKISNNDAELFRFSDEFPQDIYNDARKAFLEDKDLENKGKSIIYRDLDYEDVWTYIILLRIAAAIESSKSPLFINNEDLEKFLRYMRSISGREKAKKLYRFLPNISKGKVKIGLNPTAELDLNFGDQKNDEVDFHIYTSNAISLYEKCTPLRGNPFYLLFDELDPRAGSGVLFELDCILIRDLVVSIRKINTIFNHDQKSVYIVAAIRSEVLDKVKPLGKELYKRLEHFGFCMSWGDMGKIDIDHPLIKMACKKILFSEIKNGIQQNYSGAPERAIWNKYFKTTTRKQLDPGYILSISWFRPRDVVRMLRICSQIDGGSDVFTESLISKSHKRYSRESWSEISSHMIMSMDPHVMDIVDSSLTRFQKEFSLDQYDTRLKEIANIVPHGQELTKRYRPAEIVHKLYKAGALGNIAGGRIRFVFRGDPEPDLRSNFIFHRGLMPHFSISQGRKPSVSQFTEPTRRPPSKKPRGLR